MLVFIMFKRRGLGACCSTTGTFSDLIVFLFEKDTPNILTMASKEQIQTSVNLLLDSTAVCGLTTAGKPLRS